MSSIAEVFAVAFGVGYALLAVRRNRWAWAFGAVSSALLAWLAGRSGLPLQSALQTLYVGMAIYGFWQWSDASPPSDRASVIRRWPLSLHFGIVVVIVLVAIFLAPWLAVSTGAVGRGSMRR